MVERGRIIGSIFCQEDHTATLKEIDNAEKAGADIVELRYDTENGTYNPQRPHYLHWPLEVISTCMTRDEGGFFDGTLDEWAALLKNAVDCGADYINIGLKQAKTEQGREVIKHISCYWGNVKIIIGDHGQSTPTKEEIIEALKEERAIGADIAKVAYNANNAEDVLEIMEATLYDLGIPKIMIAMDEYGKFWRAVSLCPPWNCWGMFASVGEATAPGQLSIKEIKEILDILK